MPEDGAIVKAHRAEKNIPSTLSNHSMRGKTWLWAALEILKKEGEIAEHDYQSYESSCWITLAPDVHESCMTLGAAGPTVPTLIDEK
jgi:hypothetical protein